MAPRKPKRWSRTYQSHGKTEIPKITHCSKCKRLIGIGMVDGVDVRVDLYSLNEYGELVCILAGYRTYSIYPPHSFYRRKAWHLTHEPLAEPHGTVVRTHICGLGNPSPNQLAEAPADTVLLDDAPF